MEVRYEDMILNIDRPISKAQKLMMECWMISLAIGLSKSSWQDSLMTHIHVFNKAVHEEVKNGKGDRGHKPSHEEKA